MNAKFYVLFCPKYIYIMGRKFDHVKNVNIRKVERKNQNIITLQRTWHRLAFGCQTTFFPSFSVVHNYSV